MNVELELRMSERTLRPAEAWFLPGSQTERWLAELVRCGLAEAETLLHVVPSSASDPEAAGVLIIPGPGKRPQALPSGFACSWLGRRLCVPADAELYPPLAPAEADALCGDDLVFLHPTLGASRFSHTKPLHVWDLLVNPDAQAAEWSGARLGVRLHSDLTHITLQSPPRLQDLFGDAVDLIGTRPAHELPPGPEELRADGRSFTDQLKDMIAQSIQGVASQLPPESVAKEWVNPLTQWATRRFGEESQNLRKERDLELHRLLNQLEHDPESGLRHAIPLTHLPHRGRAKPGSRLGTRTPDFDPQRLGGEPADFWEAPADLQARLRRAYCELANRELSLRNFRRAAYIFAHLLGDVASAADALKQGKHFREAAVLYEERMQNTMAAAHCLEEGELLPEALELYERIDAKADAARVQEKRGDIAAARKIWSTMVADHRLAEDHLEAARLLDEKLDLPEEAATELQAGWPDSPQSIPCLHALLELWSRRGHHAETIGFLGRIEQARGVFWKQDGFLEILIQQARRHPDPQVRKATANLCHIAISRRLQEPRLPPRTLSRLASYLCELTPGDRLLCRDANHYVNCRRHPANIGIKSGSHQEDTQSGPTGTTGKAGMENLVLPSGVRWLSFKPASSGFYGLGAKGMQWVMIRASWSGLVQSLELAASQRRDTTGLLFEPIPPEGSEVVFRLPQGQTSGPIRFPVASPDFPEAAEISTPGWLGSRGHPVCCTSEGVWSLELDPSSATVFHHQFDGTLIRSWDISEPLLGNEIPIASLVACLAAGKNVAAVSLGKRLLILSHRGTWEGQDLPSEVHRLLLDESTGKPTILAALDQGVFYHSPGPPLTCGALDEATPKPLVALLGRGLVLIHAGEQGRVLRVDAEGGTQLMQWTTADRRIIAALPLGSRGEFALLDQDGIITRHKLPRSRS